MIAGRFGQGEKEGERGRLHEFVREWEITLYKVIHGCALLKTKTNQLKLIEM
jgi:hypothetical protein